MITQVDEATYHQNIQNLVCPDCKSRDVGDDPRQDPFWGDITGRLLVAPLLCSACGYSFSLISEIKK